jgi:hypothetical protein
MTEQLLPDCARCPNTDSLASECSAAVPSLHIGLGTFSAGQRREAAPMTGWFTERSGNFKKVTALNLIVQQ